MDNKEEYWIHKKGSRDYIEGPCEGKWMIYCPRDDLLVLWDRLCKMIDEGSLDVPGMKRSNGIGERDPERDWVIIVYTDGDEKIKVSIGKKIVDILAGTYGHKKIYWKSEAMTLRGTNITGKFFNSEDDMAVPDKKVDRTPTERGTCDICTRSTKGKSKRLGRCAHCYDIRMMRFQSGKYQGKLYSEILRYSAKNRDYGDINSSDKVAISHITRIACSFCFSLNRKQVECVKQCCWQCFQTGHIQYSSGRYRYQCPMIVAHKYRDYDGSDLSNLDRLIYNRATMVYNELDLCNYNTCVGGPLSGQSWLRASESHLWVEYRLCRGSFHDSFIGYCATRRHLYTEEVVHNDYVPLPILEPVPQE